MVKNGEKNEMDEYTKGYKAGYSEGYNDGYTYGRIHGHEDGYEQGRQEALRTMPIDKAWWEYPPLTPTCDVMKESSISYDEAQKCFVHDMVYRKE